MGPPIKVLLIEDSPGDVRLIETLLAQSRELSFEVEWLDTLTAGMERLMACKVDVVLLDLGLPESVGIDTLQRLFARMESVPTVVVLSGLNDETIALQAVQFGAQDYLVKGHVDSALLVRSIRYAIERGQAKEALQKIHAELEERVQQRTIALTNAIDALHAEIAERKRADEKFKWVLESAPDAMVIANIEGKIRIVNSQTEKLFGYERDELYAQTIEALMPQRFRSRHISHRASYFSNAEAREMGTDMDLYGLRKDGSEFPVSISLSPLDTEEGRLIIAAIRDISERKQAETERAARKSAEEANAAKSTFLANMSHELRSPLNTLLGFARLMERQQTLPLETREDLAIILRSGEHLHTLINQVLDLSKIEAERLILDAGNFDLERLLDELEEMLAFKAASKGLQLSIRCSPDVPRYIRTDQIKLRQVLINLLDNALKFTEQGKVTLQVSQLAASDGQLIFTVRDTGIGIAREELSSLFNAFVQAQGGRKMREGTGLGLAISRSFVRLMGGEMRIDSQPGKGTAVSFDLPLQVVDARAMADANAANQMQRWVVALAPGQPRYRILVVDDRREARQLLARLLTPLGFDVREAANGQEAVDSWSAWQPHLIWMDMRMPVMDGRAATRLIKASPHGKATTIIALTASSFEEERTDILAAGCDDFLRKPFQESDLFALMQKHLGVRFVYQDDSATAPLFSVPVVDVAALAELPVALRSTLEQALIQLDTVTVTNTIDAVPDAPLAHALEMMANEFQYNRILHLIQDVDRKKQT